MKILVFTGGLGNQIFGYAFYHYLRERFPQEKIYGLYSKWKMNEHYGLEIDKYFNVDLPKSTCLSNLIAGCLFVAKRLRISKSLVDMDTRTFRPSTIVNTACKTHRDYLPQDPLWLTFKNIPLEGKNNLILSEIEKTSSVFIHVRRGDYYSPEYIQKLGGTCPIGYYHTAIAYVASLVKEPSYFVFSDDIAWVKENINIENAAYIDWNTGTKSYIDLYLMAQCKYAIIANSTFSFWGAMLGRKKEIVCYPKHWVNPPYTPPEICPLDWKRI